VRAIADAHHLRERKLELPGQRRPREHLAGQQAPAAQQALTPEGGGQAQQPPLSVSAPVRRLQLPRHLRRTLRRLQRSERQDGERERRAQPRRQPAH